MSEVREAAIERIAGEILQEAALDGNTLAMVRRALDLAYEAGRGSPGPTVAECPACGRDIKIYPLRSPPTFGGLRC